MIQSISRGCRYFAAVMVLFATTMRCHAGQPTFVFSTSNNVVYAGSTAFVTLNALNGSGEEITWVAPKEIAGLFKNGGHSSHVTLEATPGYSTERFSIAPKSFATREYLFRVPTTFSGDAILEFPKFVSSHVVYDIHSAPLDKDRSQGKSRFTRWMRDSEYEGAAKTYDPMRFFQEHISGYEPFYFIAGTESPNAKFQISFKYQLVNQHGLIGQRFPSLERIHIAYTQTSLWDWNAPSAPFFDSSYKPELLYAWEKVVGGRLDDSYQLDLQLGVQHESNGREGSNSRSLNIAYIRPTLILGGDDSLQLTLQPRAWIYAGDLSDNPDIEDYRGFGDLRTIVGWKRGLQLSTIGRIGDSLDHGALQFDLTYPMMRFFYSNFSFYLHAQYFTGYGESFVRYNERSSAFRIGFSMYR